VETASTKTCGERNEQDAERDFIRRLLPLRAFDHRDHAVEKSVTWLARDGDDDAIAEHTRAACDGAAVAAALADDGRTFAGDGGFVHACDALDDLTIRSDDVARFAHDAVAFSQIGSTDLFLRTIVQTARVRGRSHFSQ
jgi:hypothetical protein